MNGRTKVKSIMVGGAIANCVSILFALMGEEITPLFMLRATLGCVLLVVLLHCLERLDPWSF